MKKLFRQFGVISTIFSLALLVVVGCSTTNSSSQEGMKVTLSGNQEVPPVKTSATGNATVTIKPDKSVSGTISTTGLDATAAHIHEGEAGKNGPVIVPFTKAADGTWSTAPGAKLTDAQYASYLAGNLYVNVHTAANKGGEIRAQLKPSK
ncbi:MAG TPA: CHRD domain-containing protein [Candidatus Limnocylindrales bacterium]|nr:CHRD domain-containing protein [Candidatus Limnocylindrales bacterium]